MPVELPPELVAQVRALGSGLAVFDADGTLWREDIGEAFLRHLVKLGWVRLPDGRDPYAEYERRVDRDKASGYAYAAQLQAGLELKQLDAEAAGFAREWVPPRLIAATGALVSLCRECGLTPMIVSASPLPIVRAGAALAGIERFRGIETRVAGARYTSEIIAPVTYAQGKIEAAGGPLALACGDSFTGDLAMLEAARVAVVVAPGEGSPLSAEARRRGWVVLPRG